MKFRFLLALWAGKLSVFALRLIGRKGTVFPGQLALAICPRFLRMVPRFEKTIAVTGTNGKTTVTNMLTDLLTADGKRVLSNPSGANEYDGVTTIMVRGLSLLGKCRHDICVYEVDELDSKTVFPSLKPDILLVTNLCRDSIQRNAHPAYKRDILSENIPASTLLILNANDLFSAFLAPQNDRIYYGIDFLPSDGQSENNLIHDALLCPQCGHRLEWDILHYCDAGRVHCSYCGLRTPDYDYRVTQIDMENMRFSLQDADGIGVYALPNTSAFNIYNTVAAATVLRVIGYDHERISRLFDGLSIIDSRFHRECVGDSVLYRVMAKEENAFACSRVFEYMRTISGKKEVVFLSTCFIRWHSDMWTENIAWLYDCDLELLNTPELCNIILYGPRAMDYKLRFLLAGIPEERICIAETEEDIPKHLQLFKDDNIFVLAAVDGYSAAFTATERIRQRLKEKVML